MKFGIGTYSFGGFASFLGLGPTLEEKFTTMKGLGFEQAEILAVDLRLNTVEQIKDAMAKTGIEVVSIHADPTPEIIDKMAEIGAKAVICAMTAMSNKAEAIEAAQWLEEMAVYGETKGIKVAYHNHSSEFFIDEGKTLLEHMIENTEKLMFQLDCGWAMNAGFHPGSFIRRHPGRIVAIHIKENCKVQGPGPRPRSRHAEQGGPGFGGMGDPLELPVEQRQKMLEDMQKRFAERPSGEPKPIVQCPIAAPESNIDWVDVKAALDETNPGALWIVEREEFYGDHDQCIADDAAWLKANIH